MKVWELGEKVFKLAQDKPRTIIAIAGAPGSGKSTLADELNNWLREHYHMSVVVPMDGFHLDNTILQQRGLLERKGAPETFDAHGFVDLIKLIREAQRDVIIPVFDRTLDKAIAGADLVPKNSRVVLVEGNYLLLKDEPWNALAALFDMTLFLNPGMDVLESRLINRWIDHGHDAQSAKSRALSNDIPNAMTVLENSADADLVIR